jgi:XRE family aerobic/anaerobic benzoate catabolism transcriptional regulator
MRSIVLQMPKDDVSESDRVLLRLGARVRAARRVRRWSLRELAVRTELSERFLGQLEAGRGNISVRNLTLLSVVLDTTAAKLLADDEPKERPAIVALLGMRGAGKTSIGVRLARRLRVPFVELDRQVEDVAGLRLSEIFALHGESYYRRLERETLQVLLDEGRPCVLAVGGGLVTDSESWALLRARAFTIWLRAKPEDHWNRVVAQGDRRPMAGRPAAMHELRRLLREREPLYGLAHIAIDTSRAGLAGTLKAALVALV